ncbi:MAG: YceD family protein [Candidatus Cyclobacteriaceae bacterium M3_2C_046]
MKDLRTYHIDVYKLKNGEYEYHFEVSDQFFEFFENSLIAHCKALVQISLRKTDTFISMDFRITGSYELTCDRSLEKFYQDFETEPRLVFKFGEEEKEIDEVVSIILKDTHRINIAHYIYEFISITVPMKKLHPKYAEEESEGESPILVYSSLNVDSEDLEQDNQDHDIDPRWLKLKKLKKK